MQCGPEFAANFLCDILKILESAGRQSLNIANFEEDEEMIDYM